MIPVRCYTNLDGYERTVWPSHMVALPHVGDGVEGRGGPCECPRLRVTSITHTMDDGAPVVRVELHR